MADTWRNGMCSNVCGGDCGNCMGAWFCPCFLYNRVDTRLRHFPNEQGVESMGGGCLIFYIAACFGVYCIPQLMKRGEIRDKFGIKGDGCTDCMVSCFCQPCSLAQMNMELKDRAAAMTTQQGAQGYVPQQHGMDYKPPPPPQGY